ncbi:MAG: glycosyltransferase [Rhodothermales bacterium]|nr:glycosyltransferase [Rhodothermales bacterium]
MRRLKILVTAYACEPGKGSEPGIGWNIVREVCKHHDLTVITRPNNRPAIEEAVSAEAIDGLSFVYYDPPRWATFWKRGTRGLFAFYYWWQIGAYRTAQKLVSNNEYDLVHHVTFGRYWSPSFLYRLGLPVVWGPVGGGESTPDELMATLPVGGQLYERIRSAVRYLGECDPFVRGMARGSSLVMATTLESQQRIRALGASNVAILGNAALDISEIDALAGVSLTNGQAPIFASIGRLLHWKGFHLGLQAFAKADIPDAEYWIVGSGPAEVHLRQLAAALNIAEKVKFTGKLSRVETMDVMANVDVLVHPSFHDSGGWVCIEAMAAGRPVIALNLGGPSLMVSDECGARIDVESEHQVVDDLSEALLRFSNTAIREEAGRKARERARSMFTWQEKGSRIAREYMRVVGNLDQLVTAPDGANVEHQL